MNGGGAGINRDGTGNEFGQGRGQWKQGRGSIEGGTGKWGSMEAG